MPLWAFHGKEDDVVPEEESARMIDAVRQAGGKPAYSALDGVGHGVWHLAYGPQGAMSWMFAQHNPAPPDLPLQTGGTSIAPSPDLP